MRPGAEVCVSQGEYVPGISIAPSENGEMEGDETKGESGGFIDGAFQTGRAGPLS